MQDANLAQLITDMKESLERQINRVEQKMQNGFAEVTARFNTQAARLERHAGLLQTGN